MADDAEPVIGPNVPLEPLAHSSAPSSCAARVASVVCSDREARALRLMTRLGAIFGANNGRGYPIYFRIRSVSVSASFRMRAHSTTASSRRPIRSASSGQPIQRHRHQSQQRGTPVVIKSSAVLCVSPSGQLPRADRHSLSDVADVSMQSAHYRHATTRRADEAASGRAPGSMALRDRQTGQAEGGLERFE